MSGGCVWTSTSCLGLFCCLRRRWTKTAPSLPCAFVSTLHDASKMDDASSVGSVDASRPLPITFGTWRNACLNTPATSKEKVQSQATEIFSFLCTHIEHRTPDNVIIMNTKSSHNEALAQLIQELQSSFSVGTPYASRICALYCICGAIQGCSGLSYSITKLLGNFFLGQCGPLEPEDGGEEDSDELVRDAAVMCLTALVGTQTDDSARDESGEHTVQLHLDLARTGVERRCELPEMEEMEYDHGYDFPSSSKPDIAGGLSTLPRSRRASCFDLLRAAIDGLTYLSADYLRASSVKSDLASFASFAASCLHGESDPRCLLQLLRMLHAMQRNMLPFFQEAYSASSMQFPIVNIFDAVAPYYPIQFTPPPNDVRGITRQGLHESLMSVLCFTAYDSFAGGEETMLNLTAGLFLERLITPDNDDGTSPSSVDDKLEAMSDLAALLFRESTTSLCDQMREYTMKELSTALLTAHAEASSGATAGGENRQKSKELADACRNLVSKVALSLEVSSQTALWDIFVRDTVRVWSPLLSSSPQSAQGRSSVAYLACLSASGGPRTLNLVLQSCLPPLIDILTIEKDDDEKVAAAAYGIGAFFSSFQVASCRGAKDGVALHPHPLEPFGADAFRALYNLLGDLTDVTNGDASTVNVKEDPLSLRIAAIRALDSVLTVTPASLFDESDIDKACALFDTFATLVDDTNGMTIDESDHKDGEIALRTTSGRTIGYILGKAFEDERSNVPVEASQLCCVIDESEKIRNHLRENIFPRLLSSSQRRLLLSTKKTDILRFDWMALACCCEMNQNAANQVISALVNSLNDALIQRDTAEVHLAMRLCFVIQHGGAQAVNAFCSLSAPNTSPMDLIASVCSISDAFEEKAKVSASPEKTQVTRVSTLMLPPTSEDKEEVNSMVVRAHGILPYLLPAYEYPFSQTQMGKLFDFVSHVLPPLNDWQSGQLCIALPILSVALSKGASELLEQKEELNVFDSLQSIAPYLTDCALNPDFDSRARSAAASCLYHIITKFQKPDATECLSKTALRDSVMPCILESIENAKVAQKADRATSTLCEALGVAAVLGSAAAVRGRSSSKIADDVALFLIQLSCDGKVRPPFVSNEIVVDFAVPDEAVLHFASASAFGSMVSTEDGSPFWRQRLMHVAVKYLLHLPDLNAGRPPLSTSSPSPKDLGRLLISCYVVACSGVTALGETALSAVGDTIMLLLAEIYAEKTAANATISAMGPQMFSIKELALSAVVKLMTLAPRTVANHNSILVPILLRAYTDEYFDDPLLALPCKMLALQGLLNATQYFQPLKKSLLSIKPAVVAVLSSAGEHPSSALRQAAVDTRNAWFILE